MVRHETPDQNGQEIGMDQLSVLRDRLALLESKNKPIFIHIAGASGAGKTTCSGKISLLLGECQTFEMDRYLKGKIYVDDLESTRNSSKDFFGWDDIRVFDLSSIRDDLRRMHKGQQIVVPIFNRQKGEREGSELISPSRHVLVEGIHALNRTLAVEADIKILVTAPFHDRLMRRMIRNYLGYGLRPLSKILSNYIQRVEPSYQQHHHEYLSAAQYRVSNPGNPASEFTQFLNLREIGDIIYPNPKEKYTLEPLLGFGTLREAEAFTVSKIADQWQLKYAVGEIEYINTEVSSETVRTLTKHYSFNKI